MGWEGAGIIAASWQQQESCRCKEGLRAAGEARPGPAVSAGASAGLCSALQPFLLQWKLSTACSWPRGWWGTELSPPPRGG